MSTEAKVFTRRDRGARLRALLLRAWHKTLPEGKARIHFLSSVPGTQKECLGGRGEEMQYQGDSSGQMGKYGFQKNSPTKSGKKKCTSKDEMCQKEKHSKLIAKDSRNSCTHTEQIILR